jgi:hypothetical protein
MRERIGGASADGAGGACGVRVAVFHTERGASADGAGGACGVRVAVFHTERGAATTARRARAMRAAVARRNRHGVWCGNDDAETVTVGPAIGRAPLDEEADDDLDGASYL